MYPFANGLKQCFVPSKCHVLDMFLALTRGGVCYNNDQWWHDLFGTFQLCPDCTLINPTDAIIAKSGAAVVAMAGHGLRQG
jgi:hypothetical protein